MWILKIFNLFDKDVKTIHNYIDNTRQSCCRYRRSFKMTKKIIMAAPFEANGRYAGGISFVKGVFYEQENIGKNIYKLY